MMRIALVQLRSQPDMLAANLARHVKAIEACHAQGAELVVFPELSLCGYEPGAIGELAFTPSDGALEPLREVATRCALVCAVGAPLRVAGDALARIALFVYGPEAAPFAMEKRYLHEDELPYFSSEPGAPDVLSMTRRVGVAICYEVSVKDHEEALFARGPVDIYLASVAKCQAGVERARQRLEQVASERGVVAMMVNCVGTCEGRAAGGHTMVVGPSGHVYGALDDRSEGALLVELSDLDVVVSHLALFDNSVE